jgi:hypothetical protein
MTKHSNKSLILECQDIATKYFGAADKAYLWWQVKNPILGGYSPMDMVKMRKVSKLRELLGRALEYGKALD